MCSKSETTKLTGHSAFTSVVKQICCVHSCMPYTEQLTIEKATDRASMREVVIDHTKVALSARCRTDWTLYTERPRKFWPHKPASLQCFWNSYSWLMPIRPGSVGCSYLFTTPDGPIIFAPFIKPFQWCCVYGFQSSTIDLAIRIEIDQLLLLVLMLLLLLLLLAWMTITTTITFPMLIPFPTTISVAIAITITLTIPRVRFNSDVLCASPPWQNTCFNSDQNVP